MEAWVDCIKNASNQLSRQESKKSLTIKGQPGEEKIDKMLSDLVVYCQTVPFDFEGRLEHISYVTYFTKFTHLLLPPTHLA